jgi:hypothetical protein
MKVAYEIGMRPVEKVSVCKIKFLTVNMNHRLAADRRSGSSFLRATRLDFLIRLFMSQSFHRIFSELEQQAGSACWSSGYGASGSCCS